MKKPFVIAACLVAAAAVLFVALHRQPQPKELREASGPETTKDLAAIKPKESRNGQVPSEGAGVKVDTIAPLIAPVVPATVPSAIKEILDTKHAYPRIETLLSLSTNDEPLLMRLYTNEAELTNRLALTWALAAIGGDESARALEQTIGEDYQQRVLTLPEWEAMRDTIFALGFVAARSQAAYKFLLESSTTNFWTHARTWRGNTSSAEAYENTQFTRLAMQALGTSLNPEVPELLERWKTRDDIGVHGMPGAVLGAACDYDIGQKGGPNAVLKVHLSGSMLTQYRQWLQSENGQAWSAWAAQYPK